MSDIASCGFVYLVADESGRPPAAVKIGKAWWERGELAAAGRGRLGADVAPLARRHTCLQSCNPRQLVLLGAWAAGDALQDHFAAEEPERLAVVVDKLQRGRGGKSADPAILRRQAANEMWEADVHARLSHHRVSALNAGECVGGSEWFPSPSSPSSPLSLSDIEAAIARLPGVNRLPGMTGVLADRGGYETELGLSSWKTGSSFDLFLLLDGSFCKIVGTADDHCADAVAAWYNTGNPRMVSPRRFRVPGEEPPLGYARAAELIEDLRSCPAATARSYTDKPFSGSSRRTWTRWFESDAEIVASRLIEGGFVEVLEAPSRRKARTSRGGG